MNITIGFLVFVLLGIILSRLAKSLGAKIFKFSDIQKHLKRVFMHK